MDSVKKIIKERWYAFALWLLLTVLLASWLFPWLTRVSNTEKLTVFVGSYSPNTNTLRQRLEDSKPEYLVKLDLYSASLDDGLYDAFYTTYGLSYADVLVIPQQAVEKIISSENGTLSDYFAVIPQGFFSNEEWTYYSADGENYGIRIYDSALDKAYCSLIDFTKDGKEKQDYYIFFKKDSAHLGGMTEGGERGGAVAIAELLMGI